MIDLVEVENLEIARTREEVLNAPQQHPNALRHMAISAGVPFALIKVCAFPSGQFPR
jgi:hypothetical protein